MRISSRNGGFMRASGAGVAFATLLCAGVLAHGAPPARGPVILANVVYEQRTALAPSQIPGSGFGLYARVRIRQGEIIGELGGQFLEAPDLDNPSAYLVGLADCAYEHVPPYRFIDSREHGGNVSRINFAPRTINGRDTGFQNARIDKLCQSPYVVFTATRDIEPGTEIWVSYGPHYHYEGFMYAPPVRDFFCARVGLDCRTSYDFEP